eukprot:scaffold21548_cov56-Skeletonema_dohrnii-CCMP3373.AAC.2
MSIGVSSGVPRPTGRRQHDTSCAQPSVPSFILTVEGGPSCHGLLQMRRPLLVATAPLPWVDDDADIFRPASHGLAGDGNMTHVVSNWWQRHLF